MAKNINDAGSDRTHNLGDQKDLIRRYNEGMSRIDESRAELNEEAADLRQMLRDAGIEPKSVDFARRVKKMEQEAQDNYLDWLRVSFDALSIGEQGALFPEDGADDGAAEVDEDTANQQGLDAGLAGKSAKENPYPEGSKQAGAWHSGWMGGQRQNAAKLGKKKAEAASAEAVPA